MIKQAWVVVVLLVGLVGGVMAQGDGLPLNLTVVTGADGTQDVVIVRLLRADAGPFEVDLRGGLPPGTTRSLDVTVPGDFCAFTGYELVKPGGDDWFIERVTLTLDGVTLVNDAEADVFAPVTAESYPPNARWTRTRAYLDRCDPAALNPPPPTLTPSPTPTIVPRPTFTPTPPPRPRITCPGSPEPRLVVGAFGLVSGGAPSNLRTRPDPNAAVIGQIPAGDSFLTLEGPVCDGTRGLAWYRVQHDGRVGWVAEGVGADYFLDPVAGPPG